MAGTSPLEVGLAVIFEGRPTDQWRSNTGDAGSEMHMACTARVADATHEPAEHNDENPYKTSYRQVSVKHMSNITSRFSCLARVGARTHAQSSRAAWRRSATAVMQMGSGDAGRVLLASHLLRCVQLRLLCHVQLRP